MSRFTINGDVGDVFIRITKDRDVQLIFGEDDDSIYREVDWEGHEVYKAGVQFAMMLDSYLRNSKALDDLITTSATGSIPAELIGRDLLPIMLAGAGLEEFKDFCRYSFAYGYEGLIFNEKDLYDGKSRAWTLYLTYKKYGPRKWKPRFNKPWKKGKNFRKSR